MRQKWRPLREPCVRPFEGAEGAWRPLRLPRRPSDVIRKGPASFARRILPIRASQGALPAFNGGMTLLLAAPLRSLIVTLCVD